MNARQVTRCLFCLLLGSGSALGSSISAPTTPNSVPSKLPSPIGSVGARVQSAPGEPQPFLCRQAIDQNGFNHPGILHSCDDLRRMRAKVDAAQSPWVEGLKVLISDPASRLSYRPNPAEVVPWLTTHREGYRLSDDGEAAYQQVLLWYITGDDAYRSNAIAIARAWSKMQEVHDYIRGGPGMLYLTAAVEMMQAIPASGWTEADSGNYAAMISRIEKAGLGLDDNRLFQNQGALAAEGLMAIAVFSDDRVLWDRVVKRSTTGDNPTPGRDFAIARSVAADGQIAEMGRDQPHPTGTLRAYMQMGYTMRLQPKLGTSLMEFDNRRVLSAFEYWSYYNLGFEPSWTPAVISTKDDYKFAETYKVISREGRGRYFPNFLAGAYYYYVGIDRVSPTSMPYTWRQIKAQGPDMGWLLYARDNSGPLP